MSVGESPSERSAFIPPDTADIHELFRRVREHPDFVFGTIFVKEDFPNDTVPDYFTPNRAEDQLAEAGNEFILFIMQAEGD